MDMQFLEKGHETNDSFVVQCPQQSNGSVSIAVTESEFEGPDELDVTEEPIPMHGPEAWNLSRYH